MAAVQLVWGYKVGAMVSALIHFADRLELFDFLSKQQDFITTDQVAARMGLHRRWLMELLRGLTAAKILDYLEVSLQVQGVNNSGNSVRLPSNKLGKFVLRAMISRKSSSCQRVWLKCCVKIVDPYCSLLECSKVVAMVLLSISHQFERFTFYSCESW